MHGPNLFMASTEPVMDRTKSPLALVNLYGHGCTQHRCTRTHDSSDTICCMELMSENLLYNRWQEPDISPHATGKANSDADISEDSFCICVSKATEFYSFCIIHHVAGRPWQENCMISKICNFSLVCRRRPPVVLAETQITAARSIFTCKAGKTTCQQNKKQYLSASPIMVRLTNVSGHLPPIRVLIIMSPHTQAQTQAHTHTYTHAHTLTWTASFCACSTLLV